MSGFTAKEGESAAEITGRIKSLRSQNSVEAAPEREVKTIAAEEPVTARIRRRVEEQAAAQIDGHEPEEQGKWQRKLAEQAKENAAAIPGGLRP